MNTKEIVENWVKEKKSLYFFLPDGPYGRPFDNQYIIEKIEETSESFNIIFSNEIALRFLGKINITDEGYNLTISDFTKCIFEISSRILKSYTEGQVVLSGF
ncbi:hypothetical protein GPY51_24025 [Photorhabdus laumondii subsp. laumondii]|uniref:Photorhabdus luminescens subsp. laumondii TTO1 complete genome segment 4/17 n=3 Tax=Photorhabdus TaxID=29487 RepID=Q7N7L0_PHOLL|nr:MULTISPECIES: hypothetical protein [Photorhabdus]PQQ37051.1 hypothetical protein C6H65_22380 [Photorhabdus luminescens]AWK41017.1 hypothetical protein A4R40_05535 [Photorhabdus laumondii subsp. laumondii]AXG46346.1 hypothetical protein PluTT01m_05715 [Photorhabdus laumondii subsp. laumondii]MCC8376623.1 hypothetical protein [Photorhabdus bodei]MCC8386426.1 hypothetical protein [Photorhabdus laumondii]